MPTKTTKKKTVAAKTEKKPLAKKTAAPKAKRTPAFTQEDLALRAYFIAEKRQKLGLPGDAHSDWIEAERQLARGNGAQPKPKKA